MKKIFVFIISFILFITFLDCENVYNDIRDEIAIPIIEITTFSIASPSSVGLIDYQNHTIVAYVPIGTDLTSLVPIIAHTGESVNPASGVVQNFTTPVIYTVTSEYGAVNYTATVRYPPLATVTTTAIAENLTFTFNIAGTSAIGGGIVTNQAWSYVIERGLCWNTAGSPTISGSHTSDGSGTGVFTNASMYGLTANTTYYIRAYATNNEGTAYGNEITFNSGYAFGTDHAGGYVFYNNGNGGGLVSAKTDQSTNEHWIVGGSAPSTLNGNTSTAFGTGLANSYAIIYQAGHTGSAAKICLDIGWFLPSLNELLLMYDKLKAIGVGGFTNSLYWSSSESSATDAYTVDFYNRYISDWDKDFFTMDVRAIHAF